jgi:DNA repair protein SbcD/Mre11
MTGPAFRFLHASDLRLDEPLTGLAELPDEWRQLVADAPFAAAERVFAAALRERVAFVVLSGNLFNTQTYSPRAVSFLIEQFEKLESQGMAVYWATGATDPRHHLPAGVKLPGSVQVFPALREEELTHIQGDSAIASIIGRSGVDSAAGLAEDLRIDTSKLFSIVVAHGDVDHKALASRNVDYWALGGQPNRQNWNENRRIVHYPGAPQGRAASQAGAHGCSLVHVSEDQPTRVQFIPCHAVRWQRDSVKVDEDASLADLQKAFGQRVEHLRAVAEDRPLLVTWQITNDGPGIARRRHLLETELLPWLRQMFSTGQKPIWSIDVELSSLVTPVAWKNEDSMLGEFLGAIDTLDDVNDLVWHWDEQLPERHRELVRPWLATTPTLAERSPMAREAAMLGARLLGAEDRVEAK